MILLNDQSKEKKEEKKQKQKQKMKVIFSLIDQIFKSLRDLLTRNELFISVDFTWKL